MIEQGTAVYSKMRYTEQQTASILRYHVTTNNTIITDTFQCRWEPRQMTSSAREEMHAGQKPGSVCCPDGDGDRGAI